MHPITLTLASLLHGEEAALQARQASAYQRLKNFQVGLRQIVEVALPPAMWNELGVDLSESKLETDNHCSYLEAAGRLTVGEDIQFIVLVDACTNSPWLDLQITFKATIAEEQAGLPSELVLHTAFLTQNGPVFENIAALMRTLVAAIEDHRTLVSRYPELLEVVQ